MNRARLATLGVLVVFLVFFASSGASASWTAGPQNLSAASTAATATSTLTGTSALATSYKFQVAAASPVIVAPLTVTNTGTAPLAYTLSAALTGTLPAANVTLSLWMAVGGVCQATVPTGAGVATTGTLAALPALPGAATSAVPAASFVLCAATSLGTTVAASQGLSSAVTLTMTGRVGTQWSAAAPGAAFTQSVFRTADPSGLTCTPKTQLILGLLQSYVTLSWTAPTAGTTGTGLSYQLVRSPAGTVMKSSTTTSVDVMWADLGVSPQALLVKATETQYGTTSPGLPITLTGNAGIIGVILEHVNCPA
ncbi:hypothetical protein [Subtercola endophyticus]|uniref:hypothetical protein n=1 Tax=Subtercola endophyticus TaxID=2895559 RepID=UPI001E58CABE|nr:hypothetical protein [Subtercola endophyticus]UFS58070.1 hypothetical protein LQ955_13740 [Subtercola endophyticus]